MSKQSETITFYSNRKAYSVQRSSVSDSDIGVFENSVDDILRRLKQIFKDEQYLKRVSESRQRWMDNEIHEIVNGIVEYIQNLA